MAELTAIEFTVLMQILDRTVGWQNRSRTIGLSHLLNGGRHYAGIGHAVKKSSLMNALRSLEDRGIIERRRSSHHNQMKEYRVNLDWMPSGRSEEQDGCGDGWAPDEEGYAPSLYDLQNQST
ncbi:hypothetical protein MTR62_14700 [Novosphingobium sp. 1949]|uniref:MarR family transcriptional regulator n=1 Tax=Novosphingobium organovorum TaxID=2930092 RepID=A0ABT0BFW9_9SPHN|nr:hypothetical protein [Novosphingobium organovorum]MCJ2183934.1 hypothetical protein [Novosphingobium organovorum]